MELSKNTFENIALRIRKERLLQVRRISRAWGNAYDKQVRKKRKERALEEAYILMRKGK